MLQKDTAESAKINKGTQKKTELRYSFPRDGVMLTDAAGTAKDGRLGIYVTANAVPGRSLAVNGVPMEYLPDNYYKTKAPVYLKRGINILGLCDTETDECIEIEVRYLPNAHKKYRFSLDDNIWFLQNLAKNRNVYSSMFEDPYLKLIKTMHDRYGTVFHINIYYECPEFGGFNLTQMPDRYKDEWRANFDWLRLSAHANSDLPDRPYINADYEKTFREFSRINEQILRFAGEEVFADKVTTIHWGEASDEAVRAVYDTGVRAMVGSFNWGDPENTAIAYNLNAEQCALMQKYGLYYDKATDMKYFLYSRMKLQHSPLDAVAGNAEAFAKSTPLYTFFEMCLHEQYFYPHYARYYADYYDRFETGIRWCYEHGYTPSFVTEAFDL